MRTHDLQQTPLVEISPSELLLNAIPCACRLFIFEEKVMSQSPRKGCTDDCLALDTALAHATSMDFPACTHQFDALCVYSILS